MTEETNRLWFDSVVTFQTESHWLSLFSSNMKVWRVFTVDESNTRSFSVCRWNAGGGWWRNPQTPGTFTSSLSVSLLVLWFTLLQSDVCDVCEATAHQPGVSEHWTSDKHRINPPWDQFVSDWVQTFSACTYQSEEAGVRSCQRGSEPDPSHRDSS